MENAFVSHVVWDNLWSYETNECISFQSVLWDAYRSKLISVNISDQMREQMWEQMCCQRVPVCIQENNKQNITKQILLLCGELGEYPRPAVLSTIATLFPFLPIQNAPRAGYEFNPNRTFSAWNEHSSCPFGKITLVWPKPTVSH